MLSKFELEELEKVKGHIALLQNTPEDLKANETFMLEAIKLNPYAMRYAAPILKKKESFALKAIAINCRSYIYLDVTLQDRENITAFAIRQDHSLYFYASDRLKTDEHFKINALKINSWHPWIKLNKVIKNNFLEGLDDTFAIMYGDYGILKKINGAELDPNQLKHGLIDITLLPQISNFLINYGMPGKQSTDNPFKYVRDAERWNDATMLRSIACFIGFGLQFLRFAMAAAATLMVLPAVALVHILKFPMTYYYQHKALQLEGVICNAHSNQPVSGNTTTLAEFVATTNSSLNDLSGYKSSDITSYSEDNITVDRYGSLRSTNPLLFFKPLNSHTPSHLRAKEIVTALELDEKYNPNDSKESAIGRSFY
ncbi:hypothetical protein Lste_0984 [Legionella steelei]|uniref:DUF4116 domain-containing protein n=1 Tax=Legionella steelei TaxID=947033 RepID=A0A0W0ZF90_9GAMM|nr:DUF4116 domain-containing protein [Legionella steelei]KTD67826.1 hypothetical protein Lste_0984 [Legionella steelei]